MSVKDFSSHADSPCMICAHTDGKCKMNIDITMGEVTGFDCYYAQEFAKEYREHPIVQSELRQFCLTNYIYKKYHKWLLPEDK